MEKRKNVITFAGNPLTLLGKEVKVGDMAKDFTCLSNDLKPFGLKDVLGKKVLISVVPSIDTGVCELQTRTFNEKAAEIEDCVILTISCDLPFAQSRFCAADGIDAVKVISDHRDLDFGIKYGFAIEELRLLARGIVVIDDKGIVRYVEYVKETTDHPDYDKAIKAVTAL